MTAVMLAATLLAGPALPTVHAETKDQLKVETIQQIQAHRAYVRHIHKVWKHRREVARRQEARAATPPLPTSDGSWADELASVGFPSSAIPTMLYIISRESGGDPSAVNPTSGACGLTQLWPCPGPGALDPITNLRYAFAKYQAAGFAPWGL